MPLGYVTISRESYDALLREVKRGVEVCDKFDALRIKLNNLAARSGDKALVGLLQDGIKSCEDAARLRVELCALERQLRELDQEITPLRPPSQHDLEMAFENSVDFARSKKPRPER